MSAIRDLPEIAGLDARRGMVRIPPELDVPLTPRVRRLIDTADFRRLARISQLGLVSLVYPAAIHTRFEHSLGVYRLALLFLQQLSHDERFAAAVGPADAERFIAAALLHDVGHWPFCHPLEDIHLPDVPRHESFATGYLLAGEIADVLRGEWSLDPRDVAELLSGDPRDAKSRILSSMLSGPIDVDKMDYLQRDSLHAGVPYGRNFDQQRLIGSLCLNETGDGLAITDKGKTAAEMMVFARYVMFSEVYWHHGVRSATAMLQRAFYQLRGQLDLGQLFRLAESPLIAELQRTAATTPVAELIDGLFGSSLAALQAIGPLQPVRGARDLPAAHPPPVSVARPLRRAVCRAVGQRHRPADRPARDSVRRPAGRARGGVRFRGLFCEGAVLSPARRGVAGRPHAGEGAIRRLC